MDIAAPAETKEVTTQGSETTQGPEMTQGPETTQGSETTQEWVTTAAAEAGTQEVRLQGSRSPARVMPQELTYHWPLNLTHYQPHELARY